MTEIEEFINKGSTDDITKYQKFLIDWIINLGNKNKETFNYNNIKDIAIGIYLICKDLKLDPSSNDSVFIKYFNDNYGYGSLVHKMVLDISEKKPDLLELISEITDKDCGNIFMSTTDFNRYIETLYNNEKLSEEESEETLIFGDNILGGEMTTRELSDNIRMMTKEYISDYIRHLNLGEITFIITDSSIMYLKDTDGIKLATVTAKNDTPKQVIRYSNENGSALFLLFEPEFIKNETIYGLSLDMAKDEERGLLILEKDKDDSVYRLLFGRGEF